MAPDALAPSGPQATPLSPEMAALLGAGADIGSTIYAQSHGMKEDNALYQNAPSPMGVAVQGAGMAALGAIGRAMLRKKFPGFADILAAVPEGGRLGIAAENIQNTQQKLPMTAEALYISKLLSRK